MRLLPSLALLLSATLLAVTGWFLRDTSLSPVETAYHPWKGCANAPLIKVYEPIPRLLARDFVESRLIDSWDFETIAPLPTRPEWCITWHAKLTIPDVSSLDEEPGLSLFPLPGSKFDLPYLQQIRKSLSNDLPPLGSIRLVSLTKNPHQIRVRPLGSPLSNEPESSAEIVPGEYALSLKIDSGDSGLSIPLAILTPDGSILSVPHSWISALPDTPAGTGARHDTRLLFWAAALLAALAVGRRCAGQTGAKLDRVATAFAVAGISVVGAILRLVWLGQVPYFGETMDELDLAWAGWGLMKYGIPFGWFFDDGPYTRGHIDQLFGEMFLVVSPNLHRPPLYPFLLGYSGLINHEGNMLHLRLSEIRLFPVALAVLTIPMVYVLARRLGGALAGWIAAVLYATTPLIVVSNRLNKEDNLVAMLGILSLVLLVPRSAAGREKTDAIGPVVRAAVAGLAAGGATIAKLTGIGCIATGILLLFSERRSKLIPPFAVTAALVSLLFPLYGLLFGWKLFLDVQEYLGALAVGFSSLTELLLAPRVTNDSFGIGQYHFFWLAALTLRGKAARWVSVPLLLYTVALACSVNSQRVYGWYLAPLLPLLAVGTGIAFARMLRAPRILPALLFFGLFVAPALASIISADTMMSRSLTRIGLTFLAAAILTPALFGNALRRNVLLPVLIAGGLMGTTANLRFLAELPVYYPRYIQR